MYNCIYNDTFIFYFPTFLAFQLYISYLFYFISFYFFQLCGCDSGVSQHKSHSFVMHMK